MRKFAAILLLLLASCSDQSDGIETSADDWVTTGGDIGKSHHSSLTDISTENVKTLGLAWSVDLGTNRVL